MIEIRNLTKAYGDFVALDGVSLTIPDGSIFGFLGVNGAGKSTLLRVLSGVFKPENGGALYDDENVFENEKVKSQIFFLPDEPFYSAGVSGFSLINLYKTFYDFDEKVFYKYINEFQLNITAPLRSYSKGMKRRFFVSVAFACKVKYYLFDEVFDGLDPLARNAFKIGLQSIIKERGGTAIIASHSLRELEDVCDSFAFIDKKKIVSSDALSTSLRALHRFQVAFPQPLAREQLGFECLSFEASGSIVRFTVSGDAEYYMEKIKKLSPLMVEEIPVNFEEYFLQYAGGAR